MLPDHDPLPLTLQSKNCLLIQLYGREAMTTATTTRSINVFGKVNPLGRMEQ
jgi:hypothetical protein